MSNNAFEARNGLRTEADVLIGNSTVNNYSNATHHVLGTTVINSTAIAAGSNVYINTTSLFIGNSTVNNFSNSSQHILGTSVVNSTAFAAGSNVIVSQSELRVGNSIINSVINSTGYVVGNSTQNTVISSLLVSIGAVVANTTVLKVGANVAVDTTAITVGNSTVNAYINSTSLLFNGAPLSSGGGYYKGGSAPAGSAGNANNIFRINSNTMNFDATIAAGENGTATGPLTVASGKTLTVQTGARIAIV